MEYFEIILLAAGGLLFIVTIVFMFLYHKGNKPISKLIIFFIVSLIMMSFPVISEMDFMGVKLKKYKLSEIETLTNALDECPDNQILKEELNKKLEEVAETVDVDYKSDEAIKILDAYLVLDEEEQATKVTNQIIEKDPTGDKSKGIKEYAILRQNLKTIPEEEEIDSADLVQIKTKIEALKKPEMKISKTQIKRLETKLKSAEVRFKVQTEENKSR